jgi:2-hydroxychromene-2-carboxylate isomerase
VPMPQTTFYFDLGSPFAYLTAERLGEHLPEPVAWQPVLLGGIFKLNGRSSWALGDAERRQAGIAEVQRRAHAYGLPPLRWPDPWPADYLFAMRLATYAFQAGRGREFALEAFRAAFREGLDIGVPEHALDAAAAAGIDRETAVAAVGEPTVKAALRAATDAAHERGVFGVPTLAVGEELFWGDDRLLDAAANVGQPFRGPIKGTPGGVEERPEDEDRALQ